jgi:hypothetical protein
MMQLAQWADQVKGARSPGDLAALAKKVQASSFLESGDVEVQRDAAELLRKVNSSLGGFENQGKVRRRATASSRSPISAGSIAAVAILILAAAGIGFFLTQPRETGLPVQISVTPDRTTIDYDGRSCTEPGCKLNLKPGKHRISLRKTGYKPKTMIVTVKPGETTPLNLTAALEPVSPDPEPPASGPVHGPPLLAPNVTGDVPAHAKN